MYLTYIVLLCTYKLYLHVLLTLVRRNATSSSNHPSFIQLAENDDVVEKYKEKIMSVHNILTNNQSKQEASLKIAGKHKSPTMLNAVSVL